ncbi:MAG: hypothetical protein ACI9HK_003740 [Pirellulaceae bacterium]|jgi:hypothetical protein
MTSLAILPPPIEIATVIDSKPIQPIHYLKRIFALGLGLILAVVLGIAVYLTPSKAGMGTHQQLGFPPCTMVSMFGMRCPSCGMTTSWTHTVRGQLISACKANTGGMVLAITAIIATPWLLLSGIMGRWITSPPSEWIGLYYCLILLTIIVVDWVMRIWIFA